VGVECGWLQQKANSLMASRKRSKLKEKRGSDWIEAMCWTEQEELQTLKIKERKAEHNGERESNIMNDELKNELDRKKSSRIAYEKG